jgi:hypothetical protein
MGGILLAFIGAFFLIEKPPYTNLTSKLAYSNRETAVLAFSWWHRRLARAGAGILKACGYQILPSNISFSSIPYI